MVNQSPVEILIHIAKAVALRGQIEHIETLVGANQGVHYARGVARVDIVVNLAVYEQQVALQLLGNLGVAADIVNKCGVTLVANLFLHAVVSLTPPAGVNRVVVVSSARYGRLEEVGVLQNSSR